MSTNHEWQRRQVNERIRGALQEADSHRASRSAVRRGSTRAPAFKIVFLLGIVFFLINLLLSGCSPVEPALAIDTQPEPASQPEASHSWSMADRIAFQDRLWEQAIAGGGIKPENTTPWTLAERIRFQDRLERGP